MKPIYRKDEARARMCADNWAASQPEATTDAERARLSDEYLARNPAKSTHVVTTDSPLPGESIGQCFVRQVADRIDAATRKPAVSGARRARAAMLDAHQKLGK